MTFWQNPIWFAGNSLGGKQGTGALDKAVTRPEPVAKSGGERGRARFAAVRGFKLREKLDSKWTHFVL